MCLTLLYYAGGTNFASCFVCKQQGHLSKDCPESNHGIYPKVLHMLHCPLSIMILMPGRHKALKLKHIYVHLEFNADKHVMPDKKWSWLTIVT
jgi:hypothetical protein